MSKFDKLGLFFNNNSNLTNNLFDDLTNSGFRIYCKNRDERKGIAFSILTGRAGGLLII
jgi:hypothetical protein